MARRCPPNSFPRVALRLCPFSPTFLKGSLVGWALQRRAGGRCQRLGLAALLPLFSAVLDDFGGVFPHPNPLGIALIARLSSPLPPLLHIPPLQATMDSARVIVRVGAARGKRTERRMKARRKADIAKRADRAQNTPDQHDMLPLQRHGYRRPLRGRTPACRRRRVDACSRRPGHRLHRLSLHRS